MYNVVSKVISDTIGANEKAILVLVITWFWVQFGTNKHKWIFQRPTKVHEPIGQVHFVVFENFTSAYLFQIARGKSCDYLLIIYMRKWGMVKQKKRTLITQSGKNWAINCAIGGMCLIWKQKISLVLTKSYCSLANHNPEFQCVICTLLHFLHWYYTFCTHVTHFALLSQPIRIE